VAKKKGRAPTRPEANPNPRSLMKILAEGKARLYGQSEAKRGGTGARLQASPAPPTTHIPKPEVQGWC
jgi:hypothetical protein